MGARFGAYMNNEGLVSVILPYYNGRAFIKEALDSILSQTYKNFEVILVDDGSPNPEHSAYVKELIASYRDDRFKYFHKENRGLSIARNFAYAQSKGSHIAFIDQDDLWQPSKLEVQMEVFKKNPAVEFIFSNGETFGESSRKLRRRSSIRDGVIKDSFSQMLRGNVVPALTAIFTRSLVEKVGLSNPRYAACPDYEYFLRMSEKTDFYFVDQPLALCRLHAENTSKQTVRAGTEVLCILNDIKKPTFKNKFWATWYFSKETIFLLTGWFKSCFLAR